MNGTALFHSNQHSSWKPSLVRLFWRLKVPPPVCFVCFVATTSGSKTCSAALPFSSPLWPDLKTLREAVKDCTYSWLCYLLHRNLSSLVSQRRMVMESLWMYFSNAQTDSYWLMVIYEQFDWISDTLVSLQDQSHSSYSLQTTPDLFYSDQCGTVVCLQLGAHRRIWRAVRAIVTV